MKKQHSINQNEKFFRLLRMYQKLVVNVNHGDEILEAIALSYIKTMVLAVTVNCLASL